ncbi:MAG TPA: nucleotidyltransferase family protein [Castellaniella sp.]|nr:nucleotidyltransferase family protein [Castellaniella sp.]
MIGILLAAGKGRRFDPSGQRNKLLQPLAQGLPVAAVAARTLLSATGSALAVVPAPEGELGRILREAGCRTVACPEADLGMGASLVCGLRAAAPSDGFLIALADMPYLQVATLVALVDAIAQGADIAAPTHEGRRGNPVAFSARHLPRLLGLGGDQGARQLLKTYPVQDIEVPDPGIFRDIDHADDLRS